jgi:hypothetical protein
MYRFHYFVKRTQVPYTRLTKLQCLRIPEGDARIPALTERYKPIGWEFYKAYPYKPAVHEEVLQVKMNFKAWETDVEIYNDEKDLV